MEWNGYKDFLIVTGLSFLNAGVGIYIKVQAQVYIWGRMLGYANTDRSRNSVALLSTVLFTIGYMISLKTHYTIFLYVWNFMNWFSMAILIYVLLGFRLFARVDSFLDVKFAKDKPEKKK